MKTNRGEPTMNVTYLGHSGFLVETERAYYLFDYIRGKLPDFSADKRLYVFASHSHADHFSMKIFDENIAAYATAYILGNDIKRKFRRSLPDCAANSIDKIHWGQADITLDFQDCSVFHLKSTDIGVAFVVSEENASIYHAGDLNWWHKDDKDKAWNKNMEVNFKREIDKLKNTPLDVAFVPLDPRLGDSYYKGFKYFLDTVMVKKVFPMHLWEDYSVIGRYITEHGNDERIVCHTHEGWLTSL
jgi:L-ascorbate metabolism protein UlaG (beta-lactamase superfamily)